MMERRGWAALPRAAALHRRRQALDHPSAANRYTLARSPPNRNHADADTHHAGHEDRPPARLAADTADAEGGMKGAGQRGAG